jgi:pimeloyl-ACP methyl ester carboxylesterase
MESLARTHRDYALDIWGFGESGKQGVGYSVEDYVDMVDRFMERLGIWRAAVLGHSLGGTVSLGLALRRLDRVQQVAVVGSPIQGKGLVLFLQLAARRCLASLAYRLPGALPLGVRLVLSLLARDCKTWYRMFERDLSRTTLESFHLSIASLYHTDLSPRLDEIRMPTLAICGQRDRIADPEQGEVLARGTPHAELHRFEHSGHLPMFDEPERLYRVLGQFVNHQRVPNVN